jgi:transposase
MIQWRQEVSYVAFVLARRRAPETHWAHVSEASGRQRADDRRVLSGIIHVIRNGLRWRDAPSEYGPHKTLYNRFVRWSRIGVFARIFKDLARPGPDGATIMIDSNG